VSFSVSRNLANSEIVLLPARKFPPLSARISSGNDRLLQKRSRAAKKSVADREDTGSMCIARVDSQRNMTPHIF